MSRKETFQTATSDRLITDTDGGQAPGVAAVGITDGEDVEITRGGLLHAALQGAAAQRFD